jgi:LPXTG-motif cell wall-anchored protein
MKIKSTTIFIAIGGAVAVALLILYLKRKKNKMKPIFVEGTFKGANCDELHAFESTHGKTIGGMNTKVNAELERIYSQGINPEVTEVEVNMDAKNMTVSWKVKIEESTDGKPWVGFTSRGSSGSGAFIRANGKAVGQDFDTVLKKVRVAKTEPNAEMKLVKDMLYNLTTSGTATGKCPTRQLFYTYTRPIKFPKH